MVVWEGLGYMCSQQPKELAVDSFIHQVAETEQSSWGGSQDSGSSR
jgi:hypothetical protein